MGRYTVSIFGLGYVGLTTAACLASKGIRIIGFDVDRKKVQAVSRTQVPFYEPNLNELVKSTVDKGLLTATNDYKKAVLNTNITFLTVGTPSSTNRTIDSTLVETASRMIGDGLREKQEWHTVVVKSTVLPTTTEKVVKPIIERASGKICSESFSLCVNPEFLSEGTAVKDEFRPDRIVIGELDTKSGDAVISLYEQFYDKMPPVVRTTPVNAELIKFASNAFLCTKISFMNSMAKLCERISGADIKEVETGIGLDKRIGPHFLSAGLGWGGSCFSKDLRALSEFGKSCGTPLPLVDSALMVNECQPQRAVFMANELLNGLQGKRIALLGLSFKPNTDDMRDAVSIKIVKELLRRGARVVAYDPAAISNAREMWGSRISLASSADKCIEGADCCIIVTEWREFAELKPEDFLKRMKVAIVIDGRRIFDPKDFALRLIYAGIGISIGKRSARDPTSINSVSRSGGEQRYRKKGPERRLSYSSS